MAPGRQAATTPQEINAAILAALGPSGVIALYRSWGVQFVRDTPRASGIAECYAFGRSPDNPDRRPSAYVDTASGAYGDKGAGGEFLSIWDFAAKYVPALGGDWRQTRQAIARMAGVDLPGRSRSARAKNPLAALDFEPWSDGLKRLAEIWCHRHRPGASLAAVMAAGGRIARYPGWTDKDGQQRPGKHRVVALPCYDPAALAIAPPELWQPVAWVIWDLSGGELEVWRGRGQPADRVKMKSVGPTRGTLMGLAGLQAIASPAAGCPLTVWKTAGPSDMLALMATAGQSPGHAVITNASGETGDVTADQVALLASRSVCRLLIVPDADQPGLAGAEKWLRACWQSVAVNTDQPGDLACGETCDVRIVALPYGVQDKHGRDLRDYLTDGHTMADLLALAEQSPPRPPASLPGPPESSSPAQPCPAPAEAGGASQDAEGDRESDEADETGRARDRALSQRGTLTNAVVEFDEQGQKTVTPLTMQEILTLARRLGGDWPRRCGGTLFIHESGHESVDWLETPADYFGWLAGKTGLIDWHRGQGLIERAELFAELKRTAPEHTGIEYLPHLPAVVGHYYTCQSMRQGDGEHLRQLLDRFTFCTDIDRDLMLAATATLFWGGHPGRRPAFVITSDAGRGAGKSTAAATIANLAGGFVDFSANDDIGVLKQRLLSPDALQKRVAMLDNVKSLRFSWAELESLVTTPTISGKRMYVGEASRPNYLTWIITLNGASLSADMAQRAVIVKVAAPRRTATWEEETARFIQEHRRDIVADVLGFFAEPAGQLSRYTRWAAWERDILARLPEPSETQAVIAERQGEADVEGEECHLLEDYFRCRLRDLHYDVDTARIHIPVRVAGAWFNLATGEKRSVSGASRQLRQMHTEGKLPCIMPNARRSAEGRGFLWAGESFDAAMPVYYDLESRVDTLRDDRKAGKW